MFASKSEASWQRLGARFTSANLFYFFPVPEPVHSLLRGNQPSSSCGGLKVNWHFFPQNTDPNNIFFKLLFFTNDQNSISVQTTICTNSPATTRSNTCSVSIGTNCVEQVMKWESKQRPEYYYIDIAEVGQYCFERNQSSWISSKILRILIST